jgi:hypothetical protein
MDAQEIEPPLSLSLRNEIILLSLEKDLAYLITRIISMGTRILSIEKFYTPFSDISSPSQL